MSGHREAWWRRMPVGGWCRPVRNRALVGGVVAVALVLVAGGCGEPPPELSEAIKGAATASIGAYVEVVGASITQEGRELTLELTVISGRSEEQARELGASFVRLVKLIGPEEPPEGQIGTGLYNYVVRVRDEGQQVLARGTKSRKQADMSWE
jgi:hypothetical protein